MKVPVIIILLLTTLIIILMFFIPNKSKPFNPYIIWDEFDKIEGAIDIKVVDDFIIIQYPDSVIMYRKPYMSLPLPSTKEINNGNDT